MKTKIKFSNDAYNHHQEKLELQCCNFFKNFNENKSVSFRMSHKKSSLKTIAISWSKKKKKN